jgi:hypothetical protein
MLRPAVRTGRRTQDAGNGGRHDIEGFFVGAGHNLCRNPLPCYNQTSLILYRIPESFLPMTSYLDQPLSPDPVIEAYKKDVDRTLIRQNLKLTPTQRLQKLEEMQAWAIELRKAGRPKDLEAIAELETILEEQSRGGSHLRRDS